MIQFSDFNNYTRMVYLIHLINDHWLCLTYFWHSLCILIGFCNPYVSIMISKCIETQMWTMRQKLLEQSTFSLFDLTLCVFVHASKIGFAKPFFAPFSAKVFSEPLGKKAIFDILQKLVNNHQKNMYFCFVWSLLHETLLKLPYEMRFFVLRKHRLSNVMLVSQMWGE